MHSEDEARREFFDVASRDVARAQIRLILGKTHDQSSATELPHDHDWGLLTSPSDDEPIPQVSDDALRTQLSFPFLGPAWDLGGTPTTPKRKTIESSATQPDTKIQRRVEFASAYEDSLFTRRRAQGIPPSQFSSVTLEQLHRFGQDPTRSCPACSTLYPMSHPTEVAQNPACASKNFRNSYVDHC